MKYFKRLKVYKANNVVFDPIKIEARSYQWWVFVAKVEGKVIFNNYRYSVTTAKHQSKVRDLLNDLGIKVDLTLPIPDGIKSHQSLAELILIAEENLCNEISEQVLKTQERNIKAKVRRMKKKLEDYLENSVCFRDYEIKDASQFGHLNIIAVHQVVDLKNMEYDVNNALHSFHRDGFGKVVFYV